MRMVMEMEQERGYIHRLSRLVRPKQIRPPQFDNRRFFYLRAHNNLGVGLQREAFPLSGLALHLRVPSPLSSPKSTLGDLDVSPDACTRARQTPIESTPHLTLSI
jgi:hypothetical protein